MYRSFSRPVEGFHRKRFSRCTGSIENKRYQFSEYQLSILASLRDMPITSVGFGARPTRRARCGNTEQNVRKPEVKLYIFQRAEALVIRLTRGASCRNTMQYVDEREKTLFQFQVQCETPSLVTQRNEIALCILFSNISANKTCLPLQNGRALYFPHKHMYESESFIATCKDFGY